MPERYGITVDLLVDLGLSPNQAKVYLSTAKKGPATISEIAEHSGVRREEIYRLLPALERIGLVERLMGKPMRLITPDVTAAMSTLIRHERARAREKISEMIEKTTQIEDYLSKTGLEVKKEPGIQDKFVLLVEKDPIRTKLHEMIMDANTQISVYYSRPNLVWLLSTQSELLIDAASKGVRIKLLSTPTSGKDRIPQIIHKRFSNNPHVELKYMTGIFANFVIVDEREAMIITTSSHQPSAHNLYTANSTLVSLIQEVFNESWSKSPNWKTLEGIMITKMQHDAIYNYGHPRNMLLVHLTEKRKQTVISKLIKDNIKNNRSVLYFCSKSESESLRKVLSKHGIDESNTSSEGSFQIVDFNDFLFSDGNFSMDNAIDVWDDFYFQANDMGLVGILAIFDMQFFFDNDLIEYILEFEKGLNKFLDAHMAALCIYNEKSLLKVADPFGFYTKIIAAHDEIITEVDDRE
ncbi:MAG: MEDS domain-containing protein [Candidatus Thorarchaeota archaeon]